MTDSHPFANNAWPLWPKQRTEKQTMRTRIYTILGVISMLALTQWAEGGEEWSASYRAALVLSAGCPDTGYLVKEKASYVAVCGDKQGAEQYRPAKVCHERAELAANGKGDGVTVANRRETYDTAYIACAWRH